MAPAEQDWWGLDAPVTVALQAPCLALALPSAGRIAEEESLSATVSAGIRCHEWIGARRLVLDGVTGDEHAQKGGETDRSVHM